MNYNETWIADFAHRTLRNLDVIKAVAAGRSTNDPDVYEVTQLVNSLLGLIVFPKEKAYRKLPTTRMDKLRALGWPSVTVGDQENENLRHVIVGMRNAAAHGNITFTSGPDGIIRDIEFRNFYDNKLKWHGRIRVDDLEDLVRRIAETFINEFKTAA